MDKANKLLSKATVWGTVFSVLFLVCALMAYKDTVTWTWSPPDDLTPVQVMQDIRFNLLLVASIVIGILATMALALRWALHHIAVTLMVGLTEIVTLIEDGEGAVSKAAVEAAKKKILHRPDRGHPVAAKGAKVPAGERWVIRDPETGDYLAPAVGPCVLKREVVVQERIVDRPEEKYDGPELGPDS